jgi:hypothetical protein
MNVRTHVFATLTTLIVGLAALPAHAADLGADALTFVLLSTGSKIVLNKGSQAGLGGDNGNDGAVGGTSVTLKKDAQSVNNIVASPGGISLKKDANAGGCITGGGSVKLADGAICKGATDTSGQDAELGVISNAIGEVTAFAGVAASQNPAQTLPAIKLPKDGTSTITNTQPGLNIISVPSVTLKKDARLTLSGAPGDSVILVIDGDLKWGPDASLGVSGGTSDQVIFVVSGNVVSLGQSSQLPATIVAPNAKCTLGKDSQLIGALFCGKQIALGADSQVQFVPTAVTIP